MADEAANKEGGSKFLGTLIISGIMILLPATLALGLYVFVISPMLAEPETAPVEEVSDLLPATVQTVDFPEERASVQTQDPNEAAPILIFQCSVACANLPTVEIITKHQAWFQAKFLELHSNRTRQELSDPHVKQAILRQAKQEANALLKRLSPLPELEVLEVMHLKYAVYDL